MLFKSKIKWAALIGFTLSIFSLLVHLLLAKYSGGNLFHYRESSIFFTRDRVLSFRGQSSRYRRLWGTTRTLESLLPYASPRVKYPGPPKQNGFIFVKIYGGFEKIRSSICDVVVVARMLNATLVIPEIQESTRSRGISYKFKSFSYIYDEDRFTSALAKDVVVVKSLPNDMKDAMKKMKYPTISPPRSARPNFYRNEVLPKLKEMKVVKLVIYDGGCLQSILPERMAEYQRLRCRVAFHALRFRSEIEDLGRRLVQRLRASGQPYLAYHSGLIRETLAYHGCAELFQDVHTELIQYRRAQMIKQKIVFGERTIDSQVPRKNGSCPLMPEEVGILLRAIGYPSDTIIYLAGAEVFGGQRVLIPFRTMFNNLVDRSTLLSKKELLGLFGPETTLPLDLPPPVPEVSKEKQLQEWNKAGPRPRPLPPPPARRIYAHEMEGWYGWITRRPTEPEPSPIDLRKQAHRLLLNALDYIVSVEADAFFPGFDNDGSNWPDFASLVMGHRLYELAAAKTYRPDRKVMGNLIDSIRERLYTPKWNWTLTVRELLNQSVGADGLMRESLRAKPRNFLAYPLPECLCSAAKLSGDSNQTRAAVDQLLHGQVDECPSRMLHDLLTVRGAYGGMEEAADERETSTNDELDDQHEPEEDIKPEVARIWEQDEEMDPDD
ncbi:protein EMBRYO SAC DEVELOPMENT ARREST 30 isoform X1 [Nymphaea colorata]|nr:protein EMBRYO SAC DEVELOPMENT ARREST 30 isoform X1 [Nymphaea colorata]